MIVLVKRKNGVVIEACGRIMRGELVKETNIYFVIKRKNEVGTWTFSTFSKKNALYEVG